jgi:ATP-dependent helicase/DNAse subunit B
LLGSNRAQLVEKCAELVANNQSHRFLYLVASHPLLELVTQGILDGQRNAGVWGELPVYLFRGFVRRILSTAVDENDVRLSPRVPIDRAELPLKRSLISQILTRLLAANQLKAIAPVASRDGCVNTIANLIGEIERAAKSPADLNRIIAERLDDLKHNLNLDDQAPVQQVDFDREVALIYSTYFDLLNGYGFTEDDADQLRALRILDGSLEEKEVRVSWLSDVQLLVLDGFFDFTPVQGEILQRLIPNIPEVIVNLNHDDTNTEIFAPFRETIAHLQAIAPFEEKRTVERASVHGSLGTLRERLFNPILTPADEQAGAENETGEIRYFECGDRETEVRAIAREIKRLVLCENYDLSEIALVVRQRASYAETIERVMREESVPCNLQARVEINDVPGVRAVVKLLAVLEQLSDQDISAPRVSAFADLIKSEYFRLNRDDLDALTVRFMTDHPGLLTDKLELDAATEAQLQRRYRVGVWDADSLENTFAYVGSELRVRDWLKRARKLVAELPAATATKQLLNIDEGEPEREADVADQIENAETAKLEEKDVERKRRPARDVHPATIAWTALVIQRFAERIQEVPREGRAPDLRLWLMRLLDQFDFPEQVSRPIRSLAEDRELPQMMINFHGLEALRRALVAAIKSIEVTAPSEVTTLATFVDEVRRSLGSQSQYFGAVDRRGLRVLEATDVRGLRFRAIFIAGLIEGGFPLRTSRDWIYPHEERERLKHYGLTLEDISPATLLKEEHYFYQAACRATERLYLSRPLLLEDDSETVASYYIDELRRAVAPAKIDAESIRTNFEGDDPEAISNSAELTVALVRRQEKQLQRREKEELPRIKRLLTLARNDGLLSDAALRRIEIERERASYAFGPYDGLITDPHLLALLNRKFGPEFVHSASGLSVYGNCAYRFFGQRVLKLEPRGEAALDLQAIDAGKLLHDILRRFLERHRRQNLNSLDREALRKELALIADTVFDEHERVVPPLNKQIWKIDREIRKILLDQVLMYELGIQEDAAAHGVVPAYFEIAFGGSRSEARDPHSKEEPLELSRATFVGDETLKISGQIDRVDVARDNTLIAYDYKLSQGSTREDIKSGRSLQIPIYLEALEKLILPGAPIAGGGYYIIRGGNERRNKGLHRAGMVHYSGINRKTHAVMDDDEFDRIRADVIKKIWDFLDHMRAGHFEVAPAEKEKTCRFCDFAAVCRYDKYRIEKKRKGPADYADSTD